MILMNMDIYLGTSKFHTILSLDCLLSLLALLVISQYNQNGYFLFTCASWSHDAAIINRLKHVCLQEAVLCC